MSFAVYGKFDKCIDSVLNHVSHGEGDPPSVSVIVIYKARKEVSPFIVPSLMSNKSLAPNSVTGFFSLQSKETASCTGS